jgi:EAL domain-containing protein (putative c-di-GMP-specific phosphodiesterase class I)
MDRGFVAGIADDPRSAALVRSIVDLGRTLGMDVVAEGVETPGQLALLAAMRCRFLQGWLLGRPVPADEVAAVIDAFDPAVLDAVPHLPAEVSTVWDGLVDAVGIPGAQ